MRLIPLAAALFRVPATINASPMIKTENRYEAHKRGTFSTSSIAGAVSGALAWASQADVCSAGCQSNDLVWTYFLAPMTNNSHSYTNVAVGTEWYISYHKNIARRIQTELGLLPAVETPNECRWRTLADVKRIGVRRGTVQWYHDDSDWNSIVYDDYNDKPSQELIDAVSDILATTYPAAEIALIVMMSAGLFIFFILLLVWRWRRWENGYQ